MAASILSLLAFLLPLIVQGLQAWTDERKGGNADANIQNNRKAENIPERHNSVRNAWNLKPA